MLGAEQEIIATYVETGQAKIIFWPVVDFGLASMNAQAAADCVGQQSVDAYWIVHDLFFENQAQLARADDTFFAGVAGNQGLDVEQFNECFTGGQGHGNITLLDSIRRERGIFNRPTIDINGQLVIGSQPFGVFAEVIEAALVGE